MRVKKTDVVVAEKVAEVKENFWGKGDLQIIRFEFDKNMETLGTVVGIRDFAGLRNLISEEQMVRQKWRQSKFKILGSKE